MTANRPPGEPRSDGPSPSVLAQVGGRVIARVVAGALRLLGSTWRVESFGIDPRALPVQPVVLAALFHEDVIVSATVFRDLGARVPVSRSRDGGRITAVMRHLGFGAPPRGSSSRGGSAALRGVVRAVRESGKVSMLVDGPRGPAGEPKIGIVAAARLSGEPILPVVFVARPRLRFGNWDRTQLPLPFARIMIGWGELLPVPRDASDEQEEVCRLELGERLRTLRETTRGHLLGTA